MELYISSIGIRDGEFITSSSKATQNKGDVIQIKGTYPSSIHRVKNLESVYIRDFLSQLDFFHSLTPEERLNYLKMNSTKNVIELVDDAKISLASVTIQNNTFDGNYNNIVGNTDLSITKIGRTSFIEFSKNTKLGHSKGDVFNIPDRFFGSNN